MNIKPIAFALALMASGSASATDTNLGDITGQVLTPTGVPVAVGSFLDRYFFQLTTLSTGSATVVDFQVNNQFGGYYWNITGLTADVYFDAGTIGVYDAADTPPVLDTNMGTGDLIQATGVVNPGNYYMTISGIANGQYGGSYYWQIAALPVPEAETWTMMGLGLGLIALQLRRQGKKRAARRVA